MASATHSGPDTTLYLYTSLTAGSSHIITATSRLETILKANKVAFRAIDCATDEKARMLWSRRSKERRLPGLVKYGQVIGDLKEVEEWNEYGELHENLDSVSDIFGDTPMTDTPMPPPPPITLKDPLAKTSESGSRSNSQSRHISISDPKDKDHAAPAAASVKNLKDDNPMSMAMRQAGAEAAAKAGQRKASAASSLKSSSTASTVPAKRDSSEATPTAAAVKQSADAEEPAEVTEITDAKTPAQLAAEGATKTSTEKIAEHSLGTTSSSLVPETGSLSNEEQVLEARRNSSITKVPSRLAQETSVEDAATPAPMEAAVSGTAVSVSEAPPRHHRGSSISEASKEEIREIEQRNAIQEESEESEDSDDTEEETAQKTAKPAVQASDHVEAKAMKDDKPQDQKAKDAEAAGVSAATTAMFLSPNHDPNPRRLSADSASVYSFFDSAFSPAPLFSGAKNLDLDLSFLQNVGQQQQQQQQQQLEANDPRASIGTYGAAVDEIDDRLTNGGGAEGDDDDNNNTTPRQSHDAFRPQSIKQDLETDNYRDSLAIAPLRTAARRQVSEPLLSSTLSRISTPPSVPLPLTIRKSPTANSSATSSPSHSRSQTVIQTQFPLQLSRSHTVSSVSSPPLPSSTTPVSATATATTNGITSPISPPASSPSTPVSAASESRSLRFKKSIRSLRSKKSTQRLVGGASSPSPTRDLLPPNLPPQRQLKDNLRSVSDSFTAAEKRRGGHGHGNGPEKSSVKNLLCF